MRYLFIVPTILIFVSCSNTGEGTSVAVAERVVNIALAALRADEANEDIASTDGAWSDDRYVSDRARTPRALEQKGPQKITSKYSRHTDYIPSSVKIDDGKKILCFFATTCEHCMETAKILTEMRKKISGFPPVHIVFMDEGPEEIPNFFKFAGRDYSYRVASVKDFWDMLGFEYDTPGVVYLWNGNVRYFSDGINDNAFSESKLKEALEKK